MVEELQSLTIPRSMFSEEQSWFLPSFPRSIKLTLSKNFSHLDSIRIPFL